MTDPVEALAAILPETWREDPPGWTVETWATSVLAALRASGFDVVRLDSGGVHADGTTNHPPINFDAPNDVVPTGDAGLDASLSVPSGTYEDGERSGVENCIYIIQQSLDTVRAEAGDLPSGKTGIAAREHVIALLNGYLARLSDTGERR